jgi:hypothetical protein
MISAVFVHEQGYKFEERYGDKDSFRRALKRKHATFLHATDFVAGIAIRPANLWGYLRS